MKKQDVREVWAGYLLPEREIILVSVVVSDLVHLVSSGLESIKDDSLLVARGNELVVTFSLYNGSEGAA